MKHISLVLFTLAAQAAAGAYLILAGWQFVKRALGDYASAFSLFNLVIVLALFAFSLVLSTLHLGSPQKAYRALFNAGSSWLSREIVSALLFGSLLLGHTAYIALAAPAQPPPAYILLTCLAALLLLYCMSRLYMLPTLPSWNSPVTLLTFLSAALLLGSLLALTLLSIQPSLSVVISLPWLLILVLIIVVIDSMLGLRPFTQPGRQFGAIKQQPPPSPMLSRLPLILILSGFSLAAAAVLVSFPAEPEALRPVLLLLAFGLVSAGQIVRRVSFYGSGVGING